MEGGFGQICRRKYSDKKLNEHQSPRWQYPRYARSRSYEKGPWWILKLLYRLGTQLGCKSRRQCKKSREPTVSMILLHFMSAQTYIATSHTCSGALNNLLLTFSLCEPLFPAPYEAGRFKRPGRAMFAVERKTLYGHIHIAYFSLISISLLFSHSVSEFPTHGQVP